MLFRSRRVSPEDACESEQELCSRRLDCKWPVTAPLPGTSALCSPLPFVRFKPFISHSKLIISPTSKVDNPYTETQAEPNILARLCVTWHISGSDSLQEVPIAVEKLSSPLHNSVAEDLVPWVPSLQLFQPLVAGQSITVSSSGAPTVAGGVT